MKTIQIDGVIGWDITARDIRQALNEAELDDVELLVNSPGGLITEGVAIYNAIRDYRRAGGRATARVVGLAASMATYIPLAAETVRVEDNAIWVIHNPWSLAIGDQNDFRKEADILEGLAKLLARAYEKKTGKANAEIRSMMDEETWLYGEEITGAGFADEIMDSESEEKDRDEAVALAKSRIREAQDRLKSEPEDLGTIAALIRIVEDTRVARAVFPAELRAEGEGKRRRICGLAAVYNSPSADLGGFREEILPGAFTKTLSEGSVKKAFWNHNSDRVLGSTKAGTLRLEDRPQGLYFEIDPPDWAEEHLETIARGDVDQASFAFRTVQDKWRRDEAGQVIRSLVEVRLLEVSPAALAAYAQTDAQVRSSDAGRLQELIMQADHDLLDDIGRTELRRALVDLQTRIDPHHSEEPGNHSAEPDGDVDLDDGADLIDERIGDLARLIGVHT